MDVIPALRPAPHDVFLVWLELHEADGAFAVDGFSVAFGVFGLGFGVFAVEWGSFVDLVEFLLDVREG